MIKHVALALLLSYAVAFPDGSNSPKTTEPIVGTTGGQIKGSVLKSRLGKPIYSFRGIRYAKAPVNELRFKPPVPIGKWEGVYDATKDGPLCPQATTDPVSEDCLLLNIYSTKLPDDSDKPKRPVVVFIHGGAFYSLGATSYWYGPQYMMDQEIVLVTFNYRLGALGFLSTGDKEAPGNNGLKDQVEAMKWVKSNIQYFGGDPNSVTLVGQSSGAWSVILHMVSPMSTDLFDRAVAMSGSPLGPWQIPHNQLDVAKKQAKFVGCPDDTSANIVKCLKTKPFNELGQSLPKFKEFLDDPIMIWSPIIETDQGQPRFLTAHPINLITNGQFKKVPLMIGQTKDEFGHRAFAIIKNETAMKELSTNWEKLAPVAFGYERNTEQSKIVSKAIKAFYVQDKPLEKSYLTNIAQYNNQSVYYYRFSYQGRYSNFYTPESNKTAPYGIVHFDDLIYLFQNDKLFPAFKETTPIEIEMVTKLTTLMYNFAKTG
nr:unnamed protein product [Callosobruchus analis]